MERRLMLDGGGITAARQTRLEFAGGGHFIGRLTHTKMKGRQWEREWRADSGRMSWSLQSLRHRSPSDGSNVAPASLYQEIHWRQILRAETLI